MDKKQLLLGYSITYTEEQQLFQACNDVEAARVEELFAIGIKLLMLVISEIKAGNKVVFVENMGKDNMEIRQLDADFVRTLARRKLH